MGTPDELHTECHKANRGLFCGLLITALSFVAVSLFFVLNTKLIFNQDLSTLIFFGTECGLLLLMTIAVLLGICKLRQLRYYEPGDAFNSALLLVGLIGLYVFYVFVGIAAVRFRASYEIVCWLALGTALISCFEATLQSVFIMDGFKRNVDNDRHAESKPGRSLVTFVLVLNLVMWGVITFEVKKAEVFDLYRSFYGYLAWSLVWHCCLPLIIFFRFHSGVCLSQIWSQAYCFRDCQFIS